MLMLARTGQELGTCVHCLSTVTIPDVPSMEMFLVFEAEGICPSCQRVRQ